jgi:2-polyprenyl-3-methyl-5-hydroxy-6-metoxy-1,4-benzoquinol methylase
MRERSAELEILDRERVPREMLARVVGYLRFVNRWLGGTRAVARHFRRVEGAVTVLDVGAGAADIPLDLARRFPNVRPLALDLSEEMLAFAEGLPRVRGDARRLPFRDRCVDYVVSTHFFHHLSDGDIVEALREFDRVARRGIVVNDLLRRRRALFWIRLLTLWANPVVKFDGPLSVRRGFRVEEIEGLARRAGLGWLRVTEHFGHRFTLAGERP